MTHNALKKLVKKSWDRGWFGACSIFNVVDAFDEHGTPWVRALNAVVAVFCFYCWMTSKEYVEAELKALEDK